MSSDEVERPFESIESAYDFMNVLAETVLEAMKDLHRDHLSALHDGQTPESPGY